MADSRIGGKRKVISRSGDAPRLSLTKKRRKRRGRKAKSVQAVSKPAPPPVLPVVNGEQTP